MVINSTKKPLEFDYVFAKHVFYRPEPLSQDKRTLVKGCFVLGSALTIAAIAAAILSAPITAIVLGSIASFYLLTDAYTVVTQKVDFDEISQYVLEQLSEKTSIAAQAVRDVFHR